MSHEILTLIPARGGSKGIPGKNIRELNGKPLIWYAIENARSCGLSPVISTDCERIREVARECAAEVQVRPGELAGDAVPLWKVCQHHSQGRPVLCLPPTCPFLKPATIRNAVQWFQEGNEFVVTCAEMPVHPTLCLDAESELHFREPPIWPRQKRWKARYPTGALFLRSARLLEAGPAPNCYGADPVWLETDPIEALNIDTEWDFELCELLMASGRYLSRPSRTEALTWPRSRIWSNGSKASISEASGP